MFSITISQKQRVMAILRKQISVSGEGESLFSQGASRANHLATPGSVEARKMTATSGRTCLNVSNKSSHLGLLVKTLLESELWSSPVKMLRWEVKPICSEKVTTFTRDGRNTCSMRSSKTLKTLDITSRHLLYRLVPWEHPIGETGSSSSHTRPSLLQTPTVTQMPAESPESMRSRMVWGGYQNGTKYNGLLSQLAFDEKWKSLLPTPRANKVTDINLNSQGVVERKKSNLEEVVARAVLLPTPTASDSPHPNAKVDSSGRRWTPNANGSHSMGLADLAVNNLLPTTEPLNGLQTDGEPFHLSPLFTEEMMGFPFLWTALPYLSPNGEENL